MRWQPEDYQQDEVQDAVLGEIASEPSVGQFRMQAGAHGIITSHVCSHCGSWNRAVTTWPEIKHVLGTGQPVIDQDTGKPSVQLGHGVLVVKLPCGGSNCAHEDTAKMELVEVSNLFQGAVQRGYVPR